MTIRRFEVFRRGDLSDTHTAGTVNAPDAVQFEGVVFSDGTCAIRWLTEFRSTSVWASFADAMAVHGHFEPRYGTELRWLDPELGAVISVAPDARCAQARPREQAYPLEEYHEDIGPVLWWHLPVCEPPHVGQPGDSDWIDGWYTHWTPLNLPHNAEDGQ